MSSHVSTDDKHAGAQTASVSWRGGEPLNSLCQMKGRFTVAVKKSQPQQQQRPPVEQRLLKECGGRELQRFTVSQLLSPPATMSREARSLFSFFFKPSICEERQTLVLRRDTIFFPNISRYNFSFPQVEGLNCMLLCERCKLIHFTNHIKIKGHSV